MEHEDYHWIVLMKEPQYSPNEEALYIAFYFGMSR